MPDSNGIIITEAQVENLTEITETSAKKQVNGVNTGFPLKASMDRLSSQRLLAYAYRQGLTWRQQYQILTRQSQTNSTHLPESTTTCAHPCSVVTNLP